MTMSHIYDIEYIPMSHGRDTQPLTSLKIFSVNMFDDFYIMILSIHYRNSVKYIDQSKNLSIRSNR